MAESLKELVRKLSALDRPLVLGDAKGACAVVSPRFGARVMGLSVFGLEGENLLWVNPALGEKAFHSDKSKNWNVGGHRTWLAPEDRFYLDAEGNWFVPAEMDPGKYAPETPSTENGCSFRNRFEISDKDGRKYRLELRRQMVMKKVATGGFGPEEAEEPRVVSVQVKHSLRNLGPETLGEKLPHAGLWSLLQISPPGTVIIPTKGKPAYTDYFDPVPKDRRWLGENVITFKIDGKKRGKMGIAPELAAGAIAFMGEAEGDALLIVKKFSVDAGGLYLDRPWGKKDARGDAVQTYNDDGAMGGFAEMECHASAKVLAFNEEQSHEVTISAFVGPEEKLRAIGTKGLGIELGKVRMLH